MQRVLVWGSGNYYRNKIRYVESKYDVIGIVDRTRVEIDGYKCFLPDEIKEVSFDLILVLSGDWISIVKELYADFGVKKEKIVPGICVRPLYSNEIEYASPDADVRINDQGEIIYYYNGKKVTIVDQINDIYQERSKIYSEDNAKNLKAISFFPVGRMFGLNRGGSIARYYIDNYIEKQNALIKGRVLEIGDRRYTEKYIDNVTESHVLHFGEDYKQPDKINYFDFFGDLQTGEGISNKYDCIIMTNVLNFVKDISKIGVVLQECLNIDGCILISASGITPISRFDMDRWGHYRSFTDLGVKSYFESIKNLSCVDVETYGNCKSACCFLQGMSSTEITKDDLDYKDEDYQVIIGATIKRL